MSGAHRCTVAVAAAATLAVACGASTPSANAPRAQEAASASPAPAPAPAPSKAEPPATTPANAPAEPAPTTSTTADAAPVVEAQPGAARDAESPTVSVARARAELDVALRSLDGRPGTCGAACRALASMERATTHLCAVVERDAAGPRAGPRDDGDRTTNARACDDAKRALRAATARVRSSCGVCQ